MANHLNFNLKYEISHNGCWEWLGAKTKNGYGVTTVKNKWSLAHRATYQAVKGEIPSGMTIDHLCRRHSCVNPSHLEAVPPAVNTRRGNVAKLKSFDVKKIRDLFRDGMRQTKIASIFGIGQDEVSRIVNFKRWATLQV